MFTAILRYILFVVLAKLMDLANYILAPFVVLFAKRYSNGYWLPKWLNWFQTPDNSLDGDDGWIKENRWFKNEDNAFKRWANHVGWLYRNSCYGFAISVLGFKIPKGFSYTVKYGPRPTNRPNLVNGKIFYKITCPNGKVYWQLYYVRGYSETRCIRINLGWKIWEKPYYGQLCQHVFSPSFTMGRGPLAESAD